MWAKWLLHPCRLGNPHHCGAGGGIRSGPLVGKVATSPLPLGDPHDCTTGGWESEVAHLWAKSLRHPCRPGDPHHYRAGGEIRSGPQVGKVATSPLPSRGSPPLQSGGGGGSEVAHKWAKWLHHPCRLGHPHHCRAGGKIRSGPHVGKVATSPLPSQGCPPLHSGEGNHKWPTCGQSGYVTPTVLGIPISLEQGGVIRIGPQVGKVATSPLPSRGSPPLHSGGGGDHKWPTCGQSGYVTLAVSEIPTTAERGGEIRSGPLVGKVATSPLPSRGSPPLHSRGGNQKWPTSGQSGYVTPAVSGSPTTSEPGGEIRSGPQVGKVATSPLPSRGSPALQGGGEIRSGPLVGKVPTSPLPSRGFPQLQSGGGGNQKWPTCGQSGHVTTTVSGIPGALERGGKIRSGP